MAVVVNALLSTDVLFVSKSINETAYLLDYVYRARLQECAFTPQLDVENRFYLVTIFGSVCALFSFVENSILLLALASKSEHRQSSFLYLIVLAFFDAFVAFAYVPLIAANLLIDYTENVGMIRLWWRYFIPTFTATHVSMTSGCYLIVVATVERYLVTTSSKAKVLKIIKQNRMVLCLLAIAMGLLTKGTLLLEMKLEKHPFCSGMTEYKATVNEALTTSLWYGTVYKFWLRNILTVFLPFFALVLLNVGIVVVLRRKERHAKLFRFANTEHKSRLRSATRMLVSVVCTYLAANLLNVIVTLWEHIDKAGLLANYLPFYTYCADLVSLLTVIAGALRPVIYLMFMKQVRVEIMALLPRCVRKNTRASKNYLDGAIANGQPVRQNLDDDRVGGTEFDRVTVALALNPLLPKTKEPAGEDKEVEDEVSILKL